MLRKIVFLISILLCADAMAQDKLRIVATPNPNIFPLLLALDDAPNLPVEIIPVANGTDIDSVFSDGKADGLLAMTYTIAKKVTSGKISDLRLLHVGLWKGFSEVTFRQDQIRNFDQLRGRGLIVAGPTGGGKNGGPDLIFQAALKRCGMTLSDVNVCYLPVMEAAKLLKSRAPLNSNAQCDASMTMPASGISLVEPATTGMVMQGMLSLSDEQSMERAISFQSLFTGYSAWPQDQLPHGGLAILGSVLNNSEKAQMVDKLLTAYKKSSTEISSANTFRTMHNARIISNGIHKYFQAYNLDLPVTVVMAAIIKGELLFRADAPASIQGDLNQFLTEVVGTEPPNSFYTLR